MTLFTPGEIDALKETQNLHMQDTCIIQTFSAGSPDTYGQMTPTYTDGSPLACGLNMKSGKEQNRVVDPETKTVITLSTLRLPADTNVTPKDRIKITHRFGIALSTPLVFEVYQKPRLGSSGLLVDLIQIETG